MNPLKNILEKGYVLRSDNHQEPILAVYSGSLLSAYIAGFFITQIIVRVGYRSETYHTCRMMLRNMVIRLREITR